MIRTFLIGCLSAFAITSISAKEAAATPQMLAVAALSTPQPLICKNGMCAVELSAMCLQKNRRFPSTVSVYHPHNPDSIVLVYTDSRGQRQTMIADEVAAIRSKRSFTAVTVRIPETTLQDLGASHAAIVVAEDTTLVPEPVPFDPFPLTAEEIAETTGPKRDLASGWLSGDSDQTTTARLVNLMLNGFAGDTADRSLWSKATGLGDEPVSTGAIQAKAILDTCVERATSGQANTVRQCMETRHDRIMYQMNKAYWQASEAGS